MDKMSTVRAALIPTDLMDVRGRSIITLIVKIVEFWGRHRLTLAPAMNDAVIAALDALQLVVVAALETNPPGPD